ncbi:hypothetical protein SAMN03080603_00233 [Acetomicrobium thermoterrenum DSM 13490]|uniref:Uncharacterized protein n=1 Tax=Acetomicrobium thermoterrenum DSM 13490 TaxID=1120987 RepID=A0A1H3DPZ7_9BACT|nr:hypothetical protein [Acetomicrobium thermoterrenum]SDX67739.1 hypothetical protein SAMN03080603_00233 [Acetomicrobium thermoterrenum DSM 13490]
MGEESLDHHIVLSEDATVRDSLRALYGTAFKAASFSVGDKTCLISKDELVTARWAAIGKALWNYLEAKDMALKVEEREKKGAVPLRWNGLDLGFLTCRKKRKSPSKGKEPKNGSSSG